MSVSIESCVKFPQKKKNLKIELSDGLPSGHVLRVSEIIKWKDIFTRFNAALLNIGMRWEKLSAHYIING